MDSLYNPPQPIDISINKGDALDLLVENQGRIDYDQPLRDQRKGIVGDVTIGGSIVGPWSIYSLPVPKPPTNLASSTRTLTIPTDNPSIWLTASFTVDTSKAGTAAADTFIEIEGATKGVLYVNGINLGKYWAVGPQQSQYVPGAWLKATNTVAVLELEARPNASLDVKGIQNTQLYNNADPDCPGCESAKSNP